MDQELRLQQRNGDDLIVSYLRSGKLTRDEVKLASYLGHPEAQKHIKCEGEFPYNLIVFDPMVKIRAALALARYICNHYSWHFAADGRDSLNRVEDWLNNPTDKNAYAAWVTQLGRYQEGHGLGVIYDWWCLLARCPMDINNWVGSVEASIEILGNDHLAKILVEKAIMPRILL